MSNPKTIPNTPPPVNEHGWVRKNELDDFLDRHLPIPTQVVSNEEYYPLPQTPEQKAVEHHLLEIAGRNANAWACRAGGFFPPPAEWPWPSPP